MREKGFNKCNQLMISNSVQYREATNFMIKLVLRFSSLYLPLAGKIIVYTPNQGTNREKYFNHLIYKGKNADSRGK